MANSSANRYQKLLDSGSPPASECRLFGQAGGDNRTIYFPYRNVLERFRQDSRFHTQMTELRTRRGLRPYAARDMAEACDVLEHPYVWT